MFQIFLLYLDSRCLGTGPTLCDNGELYSAGQAQAIVDQRNKEAIMWQMNARYLAIPLGPQQENIKGVVPIGTV